MSSKWTINSNDSGILRKSEFKDKKEDLFIFGYSCKLFRDDEKALHIDQGKHLIPWMGDETLKIDRYDARGALHDLSRLEAPSGGFDWRIELTKTELDIELLCDEERFRALHTDEDEEEMYKEEELKRLHAAGYGQVGFNYDSPSAPQAPAETTEVEEPFVPTDYLRTLLPENVVLPEAQKENVIIEKTATFVAKQGAQMEILIKAKQADNPQFSFMSKESPLHAYYGLMIGLIKADKWPEKTPKPAEEKPVESEEYLHPTLGSTVIESAPSIPSIHYKPSADCDYTMLIHKMRGEVPPEEAYRDETAPGEEPPPGTTPAPMKGEAPVMGMTPLPKPDISRAPVLYAQAEESAVSSPKGQVQNQNYTAYYHQYMAQNAVKQQTDQCNESSSMPAAKSTGLSLMKHYDSDSDSDESDYDEQTNKTGQKADAIPPDDVKLVIDKMAAYVARNGDDFVEIVRNKRDPRFTFLEADNIYYPYYVKLMQQKRGVRNGAPGVEKRSSVPVSFSIKKPKEPEPILPKPALPYETSSEDETENQDTAQDLPKTNIPQTAPYLNSGVPPAVVYKIEGAKQNKNSDLPLIRAIPTTKSTTVVQNTNPEISKTYFKEAAITPKEVEQKRNEIELVPQKEIKDAKLATLENKGESDKAVVERKKKHKRKELKSYDSKEHRLKSEKKDSAKRRHMERSKKKKHRGDADGEIVHLEYSMDGDAIDLTGDLSDSKEGESAREAERRGLRAAALLQRVGVAPAAAAALPASSLASAMVETIESMRKKKAAEEEKRRRREKRRHREKYDYEDGSHRKSKRSRHRSSEDEESDYDYDSRKKRKRKEKKHVLSKHRKRSSKFQEEEVPVINIDLTNTLKELRNASPTKELGLQDPEEVRKKIILREDSSEEDGRRKKKKQKEEREYSEGEWSSDSEADSTSSEENS